MASGIAASLQVTAEDVTGVNLVGYTCQRVAHAVADDDIDILFEDRKIIFHRGIEKFGPVERRLVDEDFNVPRLEAHNV